MSAARPDTRTAPTRRATGAALGYAEARAIALALFFLGGASALVYEVAWVRLLSLAFGVSVYAVSAVLSAFMGGLALGSWLFGRAASDEARATNRLLLFLQRRLRAGSHDQSGQPVGRSSLDARRLLWLFAALQAGVALCAFLTPIGFDLLTDLYAALGRGRVFDQATLGALRFGLALAALLIPTTLMGGTLPVMGQLLARGEARRGGDLGALYAANTFGAVLGTLAAGLLLIRTLGVDAAIYVAAAIDLAVAGVALWLSTRRLEFETGRGEETRASGRAGDAERAVERASGGRKIQRKAKSAQRAAPSPSPAVAPASAETLPPAPSAHRHAQIVLAGFALSGFASLGYQVVWTRLLAIYSLNAVFSFTVMLATFLVGLAAGGALMARRADRSAQPLALFGTLELAIGVCGVLVLFVFSRLYTLIDTFTRRDTIGGVIWAEFFASGITMLLPTLLIGATFPVAARIYTGAARRVGTERAPSPHAPPQPNGGNGGPSAPPVGQRLGRLYALNTLGAMLGSLAVGLWLIPALGLQRAALAIATLNLAIGAAALLACARIPLLRLGAAFGVAFVAAMALPPGIYLGFRDGAPEQLVFYHEGADATVAVFEVRDPPLKISFVNGRSEVPTDAQSMRAFYLLGHLPALLRPEAQSALVISFGNGIATGALSTHQIPRIQAVELAEGQVEAARLYAAENRGVLGYPGLSIAHEDGRNFLLRDSGRYGIITADATHPINSSSWALFTREFYGLVREHLTDDGVFIQWLPFHDLSESDYRDIVRTFQSVFPHTAIFYTGGVHTFLVATPEPLTRDDVAALDARLRATSAGDDLGDGAKLASDLLMEEQGVAAYAAGARIVTDDTAFFLPSQDTERILRGFAPFVVRQ